MKYTACINGCSEGWEQQIERLQAFTAANLQGWEGACLIYYDQEQMREQLISRAFTETVFLTTVPMYQPETVLSVLEKMSADYPTDLFLFPGDHAGSEISVRLACRLGGSSLTQAEKLSQSGSEISAVKRVYSGNLEAEVALTRRPACIAVSAGYERSSERPGPAGRKIIELYAATGEEGHIAEYTYTHTKQEQNLEQAPFIIAAGRGVGSRENLERVWEQAGQLGAEFGVTRTAALNGWAPLNRILGASGTVASPRTALVLGASGAAAFAVGIEKSEVIISINPDREAPITARSDLAVIDDYRPVMEALMKLITNEKRAE